MYNLLQIIFIVSVSLIIYTYALYPFIVIILSKIFKKSNLGTTENFQPNVATGLSFEVKKNSWMDIHATLANLSRLGIISPEAHLIGSRNDIYTKYHIDNHNIETIRELAEGHINIIDARDLSRYLANNAARWRANSSS